MNNKRDEVTNEGGLAGIDKRSYLRSTVIVVFGSALVLYVILILLFSTQQERLMYPGSAGLMTVSLKDGKVQDLMAQAGVKVWQDAEGRYQGFKKESPDAQANWIYFYGNGDSALGGSFWNSVLEEAYPTRKWNFYVMEYPGYGFRQGRPSQGSIKAATQQALASLPNHELPLYLVGQSLGSGVVVQSLVGSKIQPTGLLLINPFTSMTDAANVFLRHALGWFSGAIPLSIILNDTWNSEVIIPTFKGRTGLAASQRDTVTPVWMAQQLAEKTPEPKRLIIQDAYNHGIAWEELEGRIEFWNFLWPENSP